jgi:hypothetical protein
MNETMGLDGTPKKEWQRPPHIESTETPIQMLKPGSDKHAVALKYLQTRIDSSRKRMEQFYQRWGVNEKKVQLYIDRDSMDARLKQLNDKGAAPHPIKLIVPYTYATVSTTITYMLQSIAGRDPMFQIGSNKPETMMAAELMQTVLQYQSNHMRLLRGMQQFLYDGEVYGVAAAYVPWEVEERMRTVWRTGGLQGAITGQEKIQTRENRVVYEGCGFQNIDPFMLLPDPNVPMHKVNTDGEFVAWTKFVGLHTLKRDAAGGSIMYLDAIGRMPRGSQSKGDSERALMADGQGHAGEYQDQGRTVGNTHQVVNISIEIIPRELGLGESELPEKWLFAIANDRQIIMAEPLGADHDKHPVVVAEPYTTGYGFGQLGAPDLLVGLQDYMTWLMNSHIENVRIALNNELVVDPQAIEMQDLKSSKPGKLIRLKAAARGRDIRSIVQQLEFRDVTGGHMGDLEAASRLADGMFGVNDHIRGLLPNTGRRTATEARTNIEAAASRLASHTRIVSAQAITDLTEIMSLNTQQYMSDEFYTRVVGRQAQEASLKAMLDDQGGLNIHPEMLVGDFHYPVHDGTQPLDKIAMLDVWKEIFMAVAQDPELRQEYNVRGIFEFMASLSGATNLDQFKANPAMAGQPGQGVPPVEAQVVGDESIPDNAVPLLAA